MSSSSFSRQLEQWQASFNLSGNPFAIHEADQEQQLLSRVFVDRPYLHNIFGDPAHPQAAILKADRGAGKTATREMAAYECLNGKLSRRVLPVRYSRFDYLLAQVQNDASKITIQHHVRAICRLILGEIQKYIASHPIDNLSEYEHSMLLSYAAQFADPVTNILLGRVLTPPPLNLNWDAMMPYDTLYELARLVTCLRVSDQKRASEDELHLCSVYILVDRTDESEAGAEAALPILAPLVSQAAFLNMPNLAFKFFLPKGVTDELLDRCPVPDRLCRDEITWGEESLRSIIDQRLWYFSNGYISHFEELCSTSLRSIVMHRLIDACEGSPRALIRLCQSLIYTHLELGTSGAFLERTDLNNAIQTFKEEYQLDLEQETQPPALELLAESKLLVETQPEKGLYIDRSGHVWVDNRHVTETFSEQEYRLLTALYSKSPKVVQAEELIKTIWRSDYALGEGYEINADNQNLRKLVARLRDRLEPQNNGKTSRFIKNAHGRGYWLEKN